MSGADLKSGLSLLNLRDLVAGFLPGSLLFQPHSPFVLDEAPKITKNGRPVNTIFPALFQLLVYKVAEQKLRRLGRENSHGRNEGEFVLNRQAIEDSPSEELRARREALSPTRANELLPLCAGGYRFS